LDKKKDSGQARMTGFWTSQNDRILDKPE